MTWSVEKENSNKHPSRHRIENPAPLAQLSSLSRLSNLKAYPSVKSGTLPQFSLSLSPHLCYQIMVMNFRKSPNKLMGKACPRHKDTRHVHDGNVVQSVGVRLRYWRAHAPTRWDFAWRDGTQGRVRGPVEMLGWRKESAFVDQVSKITTWGWSSDLVCG